MKCIICKKDMKEHSSEESKRCLLDVNVKVWETRNRKELEKLPTAEYDWQLKMHRNTLKKLLRK